MKDCASKNISLFGSDIQNKRAEILDYFKKTYELYEKLFDILLDDQSFYEQPERLRHPLIFYFGHTAVFYINKLVLTKKTARINRQFESLFAVGVDEMSWDDLGTVTHGWPSVKECREYRDAVKRAVVEFIENEPLSLPIGWDDPFWIVLMGIEHERIHLETTSVLIRQLDISKVKKSSLFDICHSSAPSPVNVLLPVEGGAVTLGKSHHDDYYGWDNEYGSFDAKLESFEASKYLVTNGQFLEFVLDGGYAKEQFWSEEGLSWREFAKASHPPFWLPKADSYDYRALSEIIPMPQDWPVDVNFHEAKAYCNWLGNKTSQDVRLPSEAEWNKLAQLTKVTDESIVSKEVKANMNLDYYASSCPVTLFAHGGFYDVVGNVWQWCENAIYAFEGFEPHEVYDDFSLPTFDGRHNIIKGGSFISTGNELLPSSRYAFRRHFFQHAGFRYVVSPNPTKEASESCERDEAISQYLKSQYAPECLAAKAVQIVLKHGVPASRKRALDVGCLVGRGSFELASYFDEVVGIDYSARLIRCAEEIKNSGQIGYLIQTAEGKKEPKEASASAIGISSESRSRVSFWQGDACNLKPNFTGFDLVLAVDLTHRLYAPEAFLSHIHERLNESGVLVLSVNILAGERVGLDRVKEILNINFNESLAPKELESILNSEASKVMVWIKK